MRRHGALACALAGLVAATAVGTSQASPGDVDDGCFVVRQGRGIVTVVAEGVVFGRFFSGRVSIDDLTPEDAKAPRVFGDTRVQEITETRVLYSGQNVRFRVSGKFRLRVFAVDTDLSFVGNGHAVVTSADYLDAGEYSADATSFCEDGFEPLPDLPKRVSIGSASTD